MGADELFGGYRKHLACVMAASTSSLPAVPRTAVRAAVHRLPVAWPAAAACATPAGRSAS